MQAQASALALAFLVQLHSSTCRDATQNTKRWRGCNVEYEKMVVNLPPAYPPPDSSDRPFTPFEAYLSAKREGKHAAQPVQQALVHAQVLATQEPRKASHRAATHLGAGTLADAADESDTNLQNKASAPWVQVNGLTSRQSGVAQHHSTLSARAQALQSTTPAAAAPILPRPGPTVLEVSGARPFTKVAIAAPTEPLSALAEAAANLAAAARSLASSPPPPARGFTPGPPAPQVQASYTALAKAAEQLAVNVGSAGSTQNVSPPQRAAGVQAGSKGSPAKHPSGLPLPPASPSTSGAPAATAAAGPALDSRGSGSLMAPFANGVGAGWSTGGSTGSVVPAGRVSTPKFKPINPLVVLQTVQQQQAAAAGARTPGSARPGTGASRPGTANPITHTMEPDLRPGSTCGPPSSSGGRGQATHSSNRGRTPGPGDAGSDVAQVLHVNQGAGEQGPSQQQQQQGEQKLSGRTNGRAVDPVTFYLTQPHRVRLTSWPPATPITQTEIDEDEYAMMYNTVLGKMRDRMLTHGVGHIVRSFKQADTDGSGQLDVTEFAQVLSQLDLGMPLDTRVLGMLMNKMDKDHDGTINYLEFVEAVRFNQLPYQQYSTKFRHRAGGNPDEPFGPPSVSFPWGTLEDIERNNEANRARMDVAFKELRLAFQAMDLDGDGQIDREEFTAALKWLNDRHKLNLTDHYIRSAFREADADFSQSLNYDEFLASFAGAAATRFVPEFLKPQSLRCSSLAPPWEDRLGTAPDELTRRSSIRRGSTGHAASIAGAVASMPQAASGSPAPGSGSLRLPPSTPGGTPLQMHQRIALMQQFLNHRLNPSASSGGNGGANIFTANSKAAPQLGANGKGPVDQVSTMRLTTQATRLLRHLQS